MICLIVSLMFIVFIVAKTLLRHFAAAQIVMKVVHTFEFSCYNTINSKVSLHRY